MGFRPRSLLLNSARFRRLLCRILCRFFRGLKVGIGHLQIVLLGDGLAVADPFANDVNRKRFR